MTMRGVVFIVAFWVVLSTSSIEAVAATSLSTAVASPTERAERAATGPNSDGTRYAERERSAKGLEKFRGGEGVKIYIGVSVVAVALVVVIALLIL